MIKLYNGDCIEIMKEIHDASVDFTLTDIPYDEVNRDGNGLRSLNKSIADKLTFDLQKFLSEVYRITRNNILIFCGWEQFSSIAQFFTRMGGGDNKTHCLGKVQPFSDEWSTRLFKWRRTRRMAQEKRLGGI